MPRSVLLHESPPARVPIASTADSASHAATSATTDVEVVQIWLMATTGRSNHTFLSYRREASRFLVFLQQCGLSLAAVKVETVHAYLALLADPPSAWRINDTPKSERLITQVLKGPLAAQSIAHARVVLLRLYRYLQDAGYVRTNPVALAFKVSYPDVPMHDKALEPEAWVFFWRWLLQQEQQALQTDQARELQLSAVRNRWLCAVLYHTGLRRSSVAAAKMSGFRRRRVGQQDQWSLTVPSKGGRLHTVMVSALLWAELKRYRQWVGLVGEPMPDEDEPLVCNVRDCREPIGERAIGLIFERLTAAAILTCTDSHILRQISRLTPHGLRHTHGTHRLMSGATLESTQASLGHRDPKTTMIYAKVAEDTLRIHAQQMDDFVLQMLDDRSDIRR
jgi:integrase/recombinase XerC